MTDQQRIIEAVWMEWRNSALPADQSDTPLTAALVRLYGEIPDGDCERVHDGQHFPECCWPCEFNAVCEARAAVTAAIQHPSEEA